MISLDGPIFRLEMLHILVLVVVSMVTIVLQRERLISIIELGDGPECCSFSAYATAACVSDVLSAEVYGGERDGTCVLSADRQGERSV